MGEDIYERRERIGWIAGPKEDVGPRSILK